MHAAPRRTRHGLTAALTALVAALAAGVLAPPAGADDGPLDYVALGDSYSAGSGVLPLDPDARPICQRSIRNFPHVAAAALDADLTDVTCGGAETADLYSAQYWRVPAQLDALTADTDLVTLTIGGNDSSTFITAILACAAAGAATLGYGNPCERRYGDRFTDTVEQTTYPAVRQALADVRARAPQAQVLVLGYPWILPPTKGCFAKLPIARGDVPYLRDLQATLNGVVEQAAADTGATFVDLAQRSEGHDACASSTTRWVEPLLWGTNTVPVHPNARGEAAMADAVLDALGS
ncbi:lysophospholipase L1-like esterase [Isoptericola jiangsuensis]|uniref:Lysophospholipase L1-like esterase n=1 Tax=Isoptericola jiangsuensis TaxID=548579 RepID=A0A2A9EY47_9MICO|nr:SGNH/GDSL hydrolase family protein [Isoptericola jiangsuensis]PFG43673.1 lysophospholipase L1-like esterase [Isoptericola jiangsuensis]